MIKLKHFLDSVEDDDGPRIWIEPVGLTKDLTEWCHVHFRLPQVAPPRDLWLWFEKHPEDYDVFRGRYHEMLASRRVCDALRQFVAHSSFHNFTLLHQGSDPEHNTATALYEFLTDISAYSSPDE